MKFIGIIGIPVIILCYLLTFKTSSGNYFISNNLGKGNLLANFDSSTIDHKILGNFYINNYQFNLPDPQFWAISQNSSGEMIFAHRTGIMVFNGSSYTNIKLNQSPLCLKEYNEKEIIFVGCNNSYGYLKKDKTGQYQYQKLTDRRSGTGEISEIKITNSYVYFFSSQSVFCHEIGSLKLHHAYYPAKDEHYNGILQLGNEIFINSYNRGLYNIENENKRSYIQNSKAFSQLEVYFSFELSKIKLLIGTEGNRFFTFDGIRLSEYSFEGQKYIEDNQLVGGINLSERHYVLSTLSGGAVIIDKKTSKIDNTINYQNGLPDNEIFSMGSDMHGGLWLSHGLGISRINYKLPVRDYGSYPGLEGNLTDVVEFNNRIYVSTTLGVYFLDSVKDQEEIVPFVKKQDEEDKKEEIIIPVEEINEKAEEIEEKVVEEPVKEKKWWQFGKGKKDNKKKSKEEKAVDELEPKVIEEKEPLKKDEIIKSEVEKKIPETIRKKQRPVIKKKASGDLSFIFRKVKDINGKCKQLSKSGNKLLVATNKGLFEIEQDKSIPILKSIYINIIVPSKYKELFYIGTGEGITALKNENNKWKEFPDIKPDGFNEAVYSIAEDDNDNLWIGTGNSVYYFVMGESLLTKSYQLFEIEKNSQSKISVKNIDNQNYFISPREIYRFDQTTKKAEQDLQILQKIPFYSQCLNDQPGITWFQGDDQWYHLGSDFNLSIHQVSLLNLFEHIQNIRVDNENNLWVIDGKDKLYMIQPIDKPDPYLSDFKVYLERIQGDSGRMLTLEETVIPLEIKSISFKIGAPYYLRPEGVKYQYYIKGRMNNWSEWSSSSTFDFIVYPRNFRLKLRAKNIFGDVSESVDYLITVQTPIWTKMWFLVACVASLVVFVFIIIIFILKKRELRLQRDNRKLEQRIAERTQEILKQKEQIEFKNKEITDSLNYASQIQLAILPSLNIIREFVDDYFLINKPKDIVSGDFYWAAKINEKLIVTAADCTGHGVPGAFLSLLGVTFLNDITSRIEKLHANTILDNLRNRVIKSLHQQGLDKKRLDGIDLSLTIIDLNSMELEFAGANNPLYIVRNGHLTEFRGNRMPIGVQSYKIEPFTNHLIEIKKEDRIYLFSDGYIDQFGGDFGKKFLSRNFKTLLTETFNLSMKDQKKALLDAFTLWKGNFEQIDDVLIIGIKI